MKKLVMKKLQSNRGETIAETLISVLIGALALTMLAGAVSAAANMIAKSEQTMNQYYANNVDLGDPSEPGISISISSGGDPVNLFGSGTSAPQVTYKYAVNTQFASTPVVAYKAIVTNPTSGGGGLTP